LSRNMQRIVYLLKRVSLIVGSFKGNIIFIFYSLKTNAVKTI